MTAQESENITVLRNYFDQYHLQPKSVVADQAFMTEKWEHFYQSLGIAPISLGPNTPWPNRAETAVRLLKAQDHAQFHQGRHSTCNTEESDIQTTCQGSSNCQESNSHLRGAQRLSNLHSEDDQQISSSLMLTIDRNEEELTAIQIKQLSKLAFQEAHRSEDMVPLQGPVVELQELALFIKRCNDIRDINGMLCQHSSFGESKRVRIVLGKGKDHECITSCRHMSQRCLGWFIVNDDVVDAGKVNMNSSPWG